MISGSSEFTLSINIITAHNLGGTSALPMAGSLTLPFNQRSPFVEVHCVPGGRAGDDAVVEKTPTIRNNGLNPKWNHRVQLAIKDRTTASVGFVVRDAAHGDALLGQYFLDVSALRLGFRVVPLHDAAGFVLREGFLLVGCNTES